ncbi:MAG TPA: divalent metal cation transporter [Acidimicrobiales bacterium]|jgi:NRAMP (natural resistance-associated macrophage protein)-like metal ion transporter|nr:divalent metal cation transporter [Acidimicrobiales bacterium]
MRATEHAPTGRWAARSKRPVLREYARSVGPGLITGASDDDPSGIATYAQVGARFGYGLLWLTALCLPLMTAVQEICDRTAAVTGKNLGEIVRSRAGERSRWIVGAMLGALIAANTLNIAADLVAIGEGMHLLGAGPTIVWAPAAGFALTVLIVIGSYAAVAHVFKLLCLSLLAYVGVLFVVDVPWRRALLRLVVPDARVSEEYVALTLAVLGTTISPYLFFWQSANRVEELRDEPLGGSRPVPLKRRDGHHARRKLGQDRADVFGGMFFSQLVMFSIIVATAATLNARGDTDVSSAAQAAQSLEPIAGSFARILFAIGIIGAGVLAVPVLAGAGSSGMAGLLGKDWGYSRSAREAPVFYALVAIGTIGGAALALLHVNPIDLLVVAAIVNGLAAAPFLVIAMLISGDRRVMGTFRNGRLAGTLGWLTVTLMGCAAIAMLVTLV